MPSDPSPDGTATILLAAVSDAGDLSRELFEDYCLALGLERPWSIRRSLDRLGHIEILPAERREICAAPAAMVEAAPSPKGSLFFLAGRRDPTTLETVREAAEILNLPVEVDAQARAPERVAVRATAPDLVRELAEACNLTWAGASALKLARVVRRPTLKDAVAAHRLEKGKWYSWVEGAYCLESRPDDSYGLFEMEGFGPRRYFLVEENEAWPIGRNEGLHGLALGLSLPDIVTYDSGTSTLAVRREFPLPRLVERAAVLCSGREPSLQGGALVYENVVPEVALRIQSVLLPAKETT